MELREAEVEIQRNSETSPFKMSLPIVVTPNELNFTVHIPSTHIQTLSLFNPYSFSVKYEVRTNRKGKYSILRPVAVLAPQTTVDLTVRHLAPTSDNCCVSSDKLLITYYNPANNELLGKRCICTNLTDGHTDEDRSSESSSKFTSFKHEEISLRRTNSLTKSDFIYLIGGVLVLLGLVYLPTKYEQPTTDNYIPEYLHLTVKCKIFLSVILGSVMTYKLYKLFK